MKRFATSLLRRCRHGLLSLFVSGGVLGGMLMGGMVGVPLALVSPPTLADGCDVGGDTSLTYTYTAANIGSAAPLPFNTTWHCWRCAGLFCFTHNYYNNPYICYESTFTGTATNGADSLPYTVGFTDTANSVGSMTSGTWYGVYNNPQGTGTGAVSTKFTVNVAAGAAYALPAGTYSSSITFQMDEQGSSTGVCEKSTGGGGGSDSASTNYTANFVVVPSCSLTSTPTIDFGNLNPGTLSADITAQGDIAGKCTNGLSFTVYLDGGQNYSGGNRMANGTNYIPYELHQNSTTGPLWYASPTPAITGQPGGLNGIGTGSTQSSTVYARIPSGTAVPWVTGTYTDTVIVTLVY